MVTDLDSHLVERVLESLDAELRRRERILAAADAKDLMDYQVKRLVDTELGRLPRLVLVIDEFAAMVREIPDFVPGSDRHRAARAVARDPPDSGDAAAGWCCHR